MANVKSDQKTWLAVRMATLGKTKQGLYTCQSVLFDNKNSSMYTKITQGFILEVPVNLGVDHELKTQVKNKQRNEVGPRYKKNRGIVKDHFETRERD